VRIRESVLSARWLHSVLFYVTGNAIKWLHPGLEAGQDIVTHYYPIEEELRLTGKAANSLYRKPIGAITLLGIAEGALLVLDQQLQVHNYLLESPLLRFALMLEGRMEEEAMRLAVSCSPQLKKHCIRLLAGKCMGKTALSLLTPALVPCFLPSPSIPIPANCLYTPESAFKQAVSAAEQPDYLKALQYQLVDQGKYETALAVAAVLNSSTNTLKLLMLGRRLGRAWALASAMRNEA